VTSSQVHDPSQAPKTKRLERSSDARRSVDSMLRYALQSGTASSVGDLLDRVAAVSGRRLFNALLAVLQLPEATMVCTASDWERKWRRTIKPGERPLVLLFPFGPVEFVFDVSQTEATDRSLPIFTGNRGAELGEQPVLIGLFKLRCLAAGLGVDVVAPGRGVTVAEGIRATDKPRRLVMPWPSIQDGVQTVQARWVVAIDSSGSVGEQLAKLAIELGRLFCGHAGATQEDPWPNRENRRHDVSDVEGEAVARLLVRRLAPTTQLPDLLARHTASADFLPHVGWTYVTQAADKIFEVLEVMQVPPDSEILRLTLLPWVGDLVVHQGGSGSEEVVLVRATSDNHGLPERVARAWAAVAAGVSKPWIVVARTEEAFKGVLSYFDEAPGVDPAHDRLAQQIEAIIPIGNHWLTVVEAGQFEQNSLVELHGDPPAHRGEMVSASRSQLLKRGIDCSVPQLDETWMYTDVDYATGERGSEQVLGWDDVYSNAQWRFLGDAGRVFLTIRPDAGLHEPNIIEILADATACARREVDAYNAGDFDYPDRLVKRDSALLGE
jgi:hypothetical protein